jgi:hypothetical protein
MTVLKVSLVLFWFESTSNKVPKCEEVIVQRSSKFKVPYFAPLPVVFCHLTSNTAVRNATCQQKVNQFSFIIVSIVAQTMGMDEQ